MKVHKNVWLGLLTALVTIILGINFYRFIQEAYVSCGDYSFIEPLCDTLPQISQAREALNNNPDKVRELTKISPNILVSVKELCPGKGLIIISHTSEQECGKIRKIAIGDKFLGFPSKIINQ